MTEEKTSKEYYLSLLEQGKEYEAKSFLQHHPEINNAPIKEIEKRLKVSHGGLRRIEGIIEECIAVGTPDDAKTGSYLTLRDNPETFFIPGFPFRVSDKGEKVMLYVGEKREKYDTVVFGVDIFEQEGSFRPIYVDSANRIEKEK